MSVNPSRPWALRGRYIFPVDAPPIEGGAVVIQGSRIVAVERRAADLPADQVDAGDVAILPGLCNAHTHLEFSGLKKPLGEQGMALPDWIRQVVAWRREGPAGAAAIRKGYQECMVYGVTLLGEIGTSADEEAYAAYDTPVDVTLFKELLGLRRERVAALTAAAEEHGAKPSPRWRPGLSPHAPYSVHRDVLAAAIRVSRQQRIPLAMHIGESREELELLRSGSGPFRELLDELDAWEESAFAGARPLDYLQRLSQADRALVIHGNYLDGEEIDFLAQHAPRMSLVYCPRTHAYFRHERYPLERLLEQGVRVALGTDSRASSPDLDLLAEMRHVLGAFPGVSPATILRLGTLAGARALGREQDTGSLTAGKEANCALIAIPRRGAADPHELLFDPAAAVVGTLCQGRWTRPLSSV